MYPRGQLESQLEKLLDDPLYGEARALAVERLNAAVADRMESLGTPVDERDEEMHLLSYLFSRLILSAQADTKVINWVGVTEARRAERTLKDEETSILLYVSEQLGVPVKVVEGKFQVHYTAYLTATKNLRTGKWKLVNRGVVDGKVMLDQRTLVRVLREIVVEHLQDLPELPGKLGKKVLERFSNDMENMQVMAKERQERALRELGQLDFGKAPPCFSGHLADLQEGVNLPHPARFFLTTFLTALGHRAGQERDIAVVSTNDRQLVRFALSLRAAGLSPAEARAQLRCLHPDATLPAAADQLTTHDACALLSSSPFGHVE